MFLSNFHFLRFGHKGHFKAVNFFWQTERPTDGPTDLPTDRPTDIPNYKSSLPELRKFYTSCKKLWQTDTPTDRQSKVQKLYAVSLKHFERKTLMENFVQPNNQFLYSNPIRISKSSPFCIFSYNTENSNFGKVRVVQMNFSYLGTCTRAQINICFE